jgi:hypothetical protein
VVDVDPETHGSAAAYTVTVLAPAGVVKMLPLVHATIPLAAIPAKINASAMVMVAKAPLLNRRRANKSSNPVGPASHQKNLLAVGVCGGWSMVTVRVTGELKAAVPGVLGVISRYPGEKTQRALAGRDEARQLNPTTPVQPP